MLGITWKRRAPSDVQPMRFLDKYDLQEPITGGPIKVYEALEPGTGLRRIIQILEWKEVPAEVSTLQILEQFRQTAPDPPGIILDAGRVEQTNQIYLVTSFPADLLSVQHWVNSYLARSGQAGAVPNSIQAAPGQAAILSPRPVASSAPDKAESVQPWTRHEPGAFTKEFLAALDGSYKVTSSSPTESPTAETTKEPGAFTREFLSLALSPDKEEDEQNKQPASALQPGTSGWFKDIDPGFSSSGAGSPAPEPIADKKTGEFTRFFRGHSDTPSEPPASAFPPTADVLGHPRQEGSQNSPSEFTRMFKSDPAPSTQGHEEPVTSSFDVDSGKVTPPIRFAADPVSPRFAPTLQDPGRASFDAPTKAHPSFEPAWKGQKMGTTPMPAPPRGQLPHSPVETQSGPSNSFEPAWKEDKSGATQLITPVGAQPPPPEPVLRGPSEFTRIISSTSVPGGSPPAPPPSPGPAGGAPIQVPSVQPYLPSMTAPPVSVHVPVAPAVPSIPNLAAIHTPTPPVPVPQPAPQPVSRLVSYLPLIITLNVLLFVAVAIVLYFALKSHH